MMVAPYRILARFVTFSLVAALCAVCARAAAEPQPPHEDVVVTVFTNLTHDPADEWIGASLAAALEAELQSLDGWQVVEADRYRRETWIVSGAYRRLGDRLQISARVSDAESGRVIRTVRADGTLGALAELQSRLVNQLIGADHIVEPPPMRAAAKVRAPVQPVGALQPDSSPASDVRPASTWKVPPALPEVTIAELLGQAATSGWTALPHPPKAEALAAGASKTREPPELHEENDANEENEESDDNQENPDPLLPELPDPGRRPLEMVRRANTTLLSGAAAPSSDRPTLPSFEAQRRFVGIANGLTTGQRDDTFELETLGRDKSARPAANIDIASFMVEPSEIELAVGQLYSLRDLEILALDPDGLPLAGVPFTLELEEDSNVVSAPDIDDARQEIRGLTPGKLTLRITSLVPRADGSIPVAAIDLVVDTH